MTRWIVPALLALAAPVAAQQGDLAERLAQLGAVPCADSSLTCVTLPMPLDQFAPGKETIDITFGIRPADGESRAVMFFSTGGPGTAGIGLADGYLDPVDPRMLGAVDFVFFDQRGTGPVHGITCPEAEAAYALTDAAISRPEEATAAARAYAEGCVAEVADPAILPYLDTQQAIRDAEAFRQAIGAPKIWLYGESYGTQFVQEYATAFPDAVAGVILDGVVDLSLTSEAFYADYTEAAESILNRVFAACDSDAACAAEMGRPAAEVYDALQARLLQAPADLAYPLAAGGTADRQFTESMLQMNAFSSLYGTDARSDFLRALAAAANDNLMPMLRLAYYNLYMDGETEEFWQDPTWFPSAYYAINCADYQVEGATPDEAVATIVAQSAAHQALSPRIGTSYMTERLACAFWPEHREGERPAQFAGGDWPTLILNGDADPITPITMSYDILDHARNSYMVAMQGGPHVIWGRGLECPDVTVTDLVVDGTLPPARLQLCEQALIEPYDPLAIPDPADALDVAAHVEHELDLYPEVYGWYADADLSVGCDHGGRVTIVPDDNGWSYRFEGCALWPDLAMTGTARWEGSDSPRDGFHLSVQVSGASTGKITYRRDARAGTEWIAGEWNGAVLDTPRPMPQGAP